MANTFKYPCYRTR